MKISWIRGTTTYQIEDIEDKKILNEIKEQFKEQYEDDELSDRELEEILDDFKLGDYDIYMEDNEIILVPNYHDHFEIRYNIKDVYSFEF